MTGLVTKGRACGKAHEPSTATARRRNSAMTEPEPMEPMTRETILAQARVLASELDPAHAATYGSMPPSRWLQAVDLGAELLVEHAAYRLHHGRGRGRRQHSAAMHGLLDVTNAGNLVAAVALMSVVGRVLDRSPRGD